MNNYMKKLVQATISLINVIIIITCLKHIKWDVGINFSHFPDVANVINKLILLLGDYEFYYNILISIVRVYTGFLIAILVGIPLAFCVGEVKFIRDYVYPVVEIIRPIPNAAWVPLSIVMFKSIQGSIIFITFIGAFFPIFINTLEGIDNIEENYKKIAISFKVSKTTYIKEVLFPATLPNIFTGLVLGMSGSWLGVVIAEMIGGQSGVGYMTWTSYTLVDLEGVVIGMLVIGITGAASSFLIRSLKKRFFCWMSN